MKVYLVQHGIPKHEEEDPRRPLSSQGMEEVKRMAEHLSKAGVRVTDIYHSGKLRARETAEILAERLGPDQLDEVEGLKPLDDPALWAERLANLSSDTMLVGHLPHLQKLSSLLLTGDPDKRIISFRQGGVVCMEKDTEGWVIKWVINPDIV
ncbi:MAG: phosphohistidine phosphatase SixA [Nitrospirae bacterium]|nr:phosphohistidine phosphatase SixA [Nitrospirota bacterium]